MASNTSNIACHCSLFFALTPTVLSTPTGLNQKNIPDFSKSCQRVDKYIDTLKNPVSELIQDFYFLCSARTATAFGHYIGDFGFLKADCTSVKGYSQLPCSRQVKDNLIVFKLKVQLFTVKGNLTCKSVE